MAILARLSGVLIILVTLQCFCNIAAAEFPSQYGRRNPFTGKHLTQRNQPLLNLSPRNTSTNNSTNTTTLPFGPAVSVTGGPGLQELDFTDGLEFCIQTDQPMTFNVERKEGINPGTLPDNTTALNTFSWVVKSSAPFRMVNAQMFVPFNRSLLVAMHPNGSSPSTMLTVYKRPLNATSGQFLPINAAQQVVRELPEDRIMVPITQMDGRYTVLVTQAKAVGGTGALKLSPIQILATPKEV